MNNDLLSTTQSLHRGRILVRVTTSLLTASMLPFLCSCIPGVAIKTVYRKTSDAPMVQGVICGSRIGMMPIDVHPSGVWIHFVTGDPRYESMSVKRAEYRFKNGTSVAFKTDERKLDFELYDIHTEVCGMPEEGISRGLYTSLDAEVDLKAHWKEYFRRGETFDLTMDVQFQMTDGSKFDASITWEYLVRRECRVDVVNLMSSSKQDSIFTGRSVYPPLDDFFCSRIQ